MFFCSYFLHLYINASFYQLLYFMVASFLLVFGALQHLLFILSLILVEDLIGKEGVSGLV